jgi:hypothetical protein
MRSPYLNRTIEWIAEKTGEVRHVVTVCTGSGLAARAGIMDGRRVSTVPTMLLLFFFPYFCGPVVSSFFIIFILIQRVQD